MAQADSFSYGYIALEPWKHKEETLTKRIEKENYHLVVKPADNVVMMIGTYFSVVFLVGEININDNNLYIDNADNIQENLEKDQPFTEIGVLINELPLLRTILILLWLQSCISIDLDKILRNMEYKANGMNPEA